MTWKIAGREISARTALIILVLVYLLLYGIVSVTRAHNFAAADGLTYVDVAHNIITGRGMTQSVLGFNYFSFPMNDPIPEPFIVQPVGYPLMIALFGILGVSLPAAALMVAALGYLLVLLGAYLVTRTLVDEKTAILAVALLVLFYPLQSLGSSSLSDAPALGIALISLWLLCRAQKTGKVLLLVAAGLMGGLAFATRYGYLFLIVMAVLVIDWHSLPKTVRNVLAYALGFLVPAGLLFIHNYTVSGTLTGPRAPSQRSFLESLVPTLRQTFGQYLTPAIPLYIQIGIAVLFFGVMAFLLYRQHKLGETIRYFGTQSRYVLVLWPLCYILLFSYQRATSYFDIDFRTTMPASALLMILAAALLVRTLQLKTRFITGLAATVLVALSVQQLYLLVRMPPYSFDKEVADSASLTWIQQNTTARDLIFGDRAQDGPFYFNRPAAVWYLRAWNDSVQERNKVMAYARNQCGKYDHLYILMWPHHEDPTPPVIPGAIFKQRLTDGYVYEIPCQEQM